MDTENIESLVDDLTGNVDDLEESLAPLLKTALSTSTSKLPLLDKAKLYVLATYAINSVLFSALRLNGVDAKTHPVFQELNRVKEYFAKIKAAESVGQRRTTTVDKDAAARAERQARERNGAKRKLEDLAVGTHTRFDGAAKRIKGNEETVPIVRSEEVKEDDAQGGMALNSAEAEKRARKEAKRQRRQERKAAEESDAETGSPGTATATIASRPRAGPKSTSEIFQALQQGSLPGVDDKKPKKKKRKSRHDMAKDLEDRRADEMK
ncbi:hypothetical protein LTR78_005833 [Recurvomyces mirabilis]|uniref:Exosome complex protein n=1 Tax=Recurvomyces mirabilis TaxID=574656 RepID=A0AAE1C108_9PEZI|nr:hypothetical protein LTR78_005833 [Recurvomyces mirabilis]KAK5154213.1 hypothetical protein LTS14_006898 [Recurvomyces mirabilis]